MKNFNQCSNFSTRIVATLEGCETVPTDLAYCLGVADVAERVLDYRESKLKWLCLKSPSFVYAELVKLTDAISITGFKALTGEDILLAAANWRLFTARIARQNAVLDWVMQDIGRYAARVVGKTVLELSRDGIQPFHCVAWLYCEMLYRAFLNEVLPDEERVIGRKPERMIVPLYRYQLPSYLVFDEIDNPTLSGTQSFKALCDLFKVQDVH